MGVVLVGVWLLAPLVIFAADATTLPAQKAKSDPPANCQLILEGRKIDALTVADRNGTLTTFKNPGNTVMLPAGEYRIIMVDVTGGFSLITPDLAREPLTTWPPTRNFLLALSPDKPCRPNIGMPLKVDIHVSTDRVGNLIKARYSDSIRDEGNRTYHSARSSTRESPPTFTIYKGEQDITAKGDGSLEYG
jgi:hypothetical protein